MKFREFIIPNGHLKCVTCRKTSNDIDHYRWLLFNFNQKEHHVLICDSCNELDDLAMRVEVELSLKLL